jgi:ribose transport system substrate-binding protein
MDEIAARVLRRLQSLEDGRRMDRRAFLAGMSLLGAGAGLLALAGCAPEDQAQAGQTEPLEAPPPPRLRAAFSQVGLGTTWGRRGADTAIMLGRLLGIDVVVYDGEINVDKQRRDIEEIAEQSWDFVAIHPLAVNAYIEPVRQLISRGIPVIDMDTRLADNLDSLGIVTFLEPDNIWMAEQVTRKLIEAAQSTSFAIVHTQGKLTHTGAQGRAQGFRNVMAAYPSIRVVDETPGDWQVDKTTAIWVDLLERFPDIRAAFFHNDDMALAALRAIVSAGRQKQILIGSIDGMQNACEAVERGDIIASAINPTGRIHGGALWVGYYLATRGDRASVPRFIRTDGGIVTRETAAGYIWLGNQLLI